MKLGKLLFLLTICILPLMNAEDIRVGHTSALSGPASALGKGMRDGMQAYFSMINGKGGINGNTISLHAMDDGYEPRRCAPNMRSLINDKKVMAVLGNVGTPTAVVSVPIANKLKTPLFGAFTGAGLLRKTPADRYIMNFRASYAEETEAMIRGLIKDVGIKAEEIAFFMSSSWVSN